MRPARPVVGLAGRVWGWMKRLVVGRRIRSDRLGEQQLPKRIALPVFASDPLSSVAYATQEILLILTLGGMAYLSMAPWIAVAIVVLLAVVVLSYRQVIRAYPNGGGSYEVALRNLGLNAGLVVAAALLVDYIMTVAVSVAAGVDNIISAVPALNPYRVLLNLVFVAVLTAMNLRGVRESGRIFAVPTYLFVVGVLGLIATGFIQMLVGNPPVPESAGWQITPEPDHVGLTGIALVLLALLAFSSGCTALTGAEAISNGVPAFRPPKAENAARTMGVMGLLSITMFSGITALALLTHVRYIENTCDLIGFPGNCATDAQRTIIAQLAAAVFGGSHSITFYYIQAATALILILAANTAYNGFPLLGSILAQHRYLPRQLHTRGDRLAFSNVPLTVVDAPYRDLTESVLDYVARVNRDHPRDLIVVYIPEHVVSRWWEHVLHNQSALRLKARLLFQRNVMVTSVPWQLDPGHADARAVTAEQRAPADTVRT